MDTDAPVDHGDSPRVDSFVLRFSSDAENAAWRGLIRHVQTDTERHFTRLDELLDFVGGYVSLDEAAEYVSRNIRN
ncbi:MAG TPA: hypothetical protein PLJ62_12605 [Thermoflexales bacterium]|nr:hypothetical protein [Thermoflexales bacterium]HQW34825.1 hypothetical protein [Thermoflexales bacterium]HQZ22644.1 hypothetical protein [Thermoflexales bacterium]HRA01036.1 hypothetical protein [Thermoflexales bacterium]